MNDCYVYVYIDPRNYEEFYYGKGSKTRKDAHLKDKSDSAKVRRIAEIKKEGLLPIIRVIARGLTEPEAYLVEKTLLWKLGRFTTNMASGYYADKFRPHNTFHKELPKFDYQNGIYYYNVGEGLHRNWEDYVKYGIISAGQGERWKNAILNFNPGDIVVAYLKKYGFVGIGIIKTKAQMIRDVQINGKFLLSLPLVCQRMRDNCEDKNHSEYVCRVDWIKTVIRKEAFWRRKSNLYTTQLVCASLDGQPITLKFIEQSFNIKFDDLKIKCQPAIV